MTSIYIYVCCRDDAEDGYTVGFVTTNQAIAHQWERESPEGHLVIRCEPFDHFPTRTTMYHVRLTWRPGQEVHTYEANWPAWEFEIIDSHRPTVVMLGEEYASKTDHVSPWWYVQATGTDHGEALEAAHERMAHFLALQESANA